MPGGRPTDYTQELADDICTLLSDGDSMRKICRMESMPCLSTVWKWLRENEEFSHQYDRSIQERAEAHTEDMLEIADDSTIDVQRAKLMVDTRKWHSARMKPKKYGDKIQTEHSGNIGIYESLSNEELDKKIKEFEDKSNE